MTEVIIPTNPEFKKYKPLLKQMYKKVQNKICDTNSFEFITKNTLFYAFLGDDKKIIGAIYFFIDDKKLYLNAYAGKGHHESNLECVRMSLGWFNCDIYAVAQNKASALCLLRCGFKRIKNNLFVYKHES